MEQFEVEEKLPENVVIASRTTHLPTVKKLVEVRPIEKMKWHGKTGEQSFQRTKKVEALVDAETMKYATGLSKDEVAELSQHVSYDLSDNFNREIPHPFWNSPAGIIKLENKTMLFDISQPLNYIYVKVMLASRYVANSMQEYEEGLWPDATHVIYDEAMAAEQEAGKVELRDKCIIMKSQMSRDKKIQIILSIDHKNLKGQSDNWINVALDKVIQKNATEFLHYAEMNANQLFLYSLVLEALQKSHLRKDGHKILFHESQIGSDEMDVAKYLSKEENNDLKIRLMSLVNN